MAYIPTALSAAYIDVIHAAWQYGREVWGNPARPVEREVRPFLRWVPSGGAWKAFRKARLECALAVYNIERRKEMPS